MVPPQPATCALGTFATLHMHMSTNACETAIHIDFGVTNKFANCNESANNED